MRVPALAYQAGIGLPQAVDEMGAALHYLQYDNPIRQAAAVFTG